MARELGARWLMYNEDGETGRWSPTHMFLLAEVHGREAAGFMEAGLIALVADQDMDQAYNINLKHRDSGGTGPRPEQFKDHQYFIYLAVCTNDD